MILKTINEIVVLISIFNVISSQDNFTIIDLTQVRDIYMTKTYFGSSYQEMELIIDTFHTEISIMDKKCAICKLKLSFNKDISDTYVQLSENKTTIQMNNEDFIGYLSKDVFKINNLIIPNLTFLLVYNVTHNKIFFDEGYLALGFSKQRKSLVKLLKEQNYISKAMYSLQLKKKNEKGYLCFGGYDKTEINETLYKNMTFTNIWYNDIEKDNFTEWFIPIKYLYIKAGHKANNITFAQKIILNSSIDKILIPKNFYLQYMNVIFSEDKLCEIQKDNRLHCKCDAKYERSFPTFYFHYEDSNIFRSSFKVTPSDYIIMDSSKKESESNVNCILQMSMNYKGNYWIFGTNIMSNYFFIFDHDNEQIGILEYRKNEHNSEIIILSIIIIACAATFFMAVYLIFKKCNQCHNNNNSSQQRDDTSIQHNFIDANREEDFHQ